MLASTIYTKHGRRVVLNSGVVGSRNGKLFFVRPEVKVILRFPYKGSSPIANKAVAVGRGERV